MKEVILFTVKTLFERITIEKKKLKGKVPILDVQLIKKSTELKVEGGRVRVDRETVSNQAESSCMQQLL